MIQIKTLKEIKDLDGSNCKIGLTIGNFDGVHCGHQSLIKSLKSKCSEEGQKLALITFKPHPKEILNSSAKSYLLSSYEKKKELIGNLGVDYYLELAFTRDFSTLSPEEFLNLYVLSDNVVTNLYVGHDFAFGADKKGDYDFIRNYCKEKNVVVELQDKFLKRGDRVSSSLIRNLLLSGNVIDANDLLGREYGLKGIIIKGEGRGKRIGFPTANLSMSKDLLLPGRGVYITRTRYRNMIYNSITNIGINPTFAAKENLNVETNIFDFNEDIYGEKLEVLFFKKIRNEKKFSTVNDLVEQIKEDVKVAKKFF